MPDTDSPLKRLVTTFIKDFAAWLLDAEVLSVTPRNIELVPDRDTLRSDQVFEVTLIDLRTALLHIEFQGPRSKKPMPLRMLEYMSGFAQTYRQMEMYNVVLYVGHGAGKNDKGRHKVKRPDGKTALAWHYQVIHLWKKDAEDIWALNRPALLPLIGLTQINNPQELLPKVVNKLKTTYEGEQQHRLLTELMALMNDERIATMLERLLETDEFFENTPFMRRIRAKGRAEGRQEDILKLLKLRWKLPAASYRRLEAQIVQITDDAKLEKLLALAVQAKNLAEFQAGLIGH